MGYNYLNLFQPLPLGRYDAYKHRFEMGRTRVNLNYVCMAINIICGLKNAVIMILPRSSKAMFYLVEIYIYDSPILQLFQLGSLMIQFTINYKTNKLKNGRQPLSSFLIRW